MTVRLGVDLGGTKTEIIGLDAAGAELYRRRVATDRSSYEAVVRTIAGLVRDADAALGTAGTVGVGIPGTISARTGRIKNANTTLLNGQAFDRDLEQAIGRPVRCMNDANCLAVSEAIDGAGAGKACVLAVIIGTGCGAGLAINGVARAGHNLVAGELGHNPLPWMDATEYPGPACWCGQHGCLETWISGTAFVADYRRVVPGGTITGADIIALARSGDATAQAALDRYASRLARALAHAINLTDPDVIVLGGGMSNIDELYELIPPLLPRYVFGGEATTPVVKSRHGDSSGVRGAAWLWGKS